MVALVALPVVASLCAGFGLQTGKFIIGCILSRGCTRVHRYIEMLIAIATLGYRRLYK